jgi:NADPH-dependent glutamate synthase beta subunit-like oxidoreductase
MDGVDFLRRIAEGREVRVGRRVAVVGGGNTAVDAARTALRLGAEKVSILYRRSREEMPAAAEEIEAAMEEGVAVNCLVLPTAVRREDDELRVECIAMRLGKADASGRRRPEPVPGSEYTLTLDNLIPAIGQKPAAAGVFGIELGRGDRAVVNQNSLAASRDGTFAGGDFVLGPASVIEAISHGRRAAEAIDRYLGGTGDISENLAEPEDLTELPPLPEDAGDMPRLAAEHLAPGERRATFSQVERVLVRRCAVGEAARCLRCDLEGRR